MLSEVEDVGVRLCPALVGLVLKEVLGQDIDPAGLHRRERRPRRLRLEVLLEDLLGLVLVATGDDKDIGGISGHNGLDREVVERTVVFGNVCHLQVVEDLTGKVVALRDLRLGGRDEKCQVAYLRKVGGALLDFCYSVRDVCDVCLVEVVSAAHLGECGHVGCVVVEVVHVNVAPRDAGAVQAGLKLLLRGDLGGDKHQRGLKRDDLLQAGLGGGAHGLHVCRQAVEVCGVLGHTHGRHASKNCHLSKRAGRSDNAGACGIVRGGCVRRAFRLRRGGTRIWLRSAPGKDASTKEHREAQEFSSLEHGPSRTDWWRWNLLVHHIPSSIMAERYQDLHRYSVGFTTEMRQGDSPFVSSRRRLGLRHTE